MAGYDSLPLALLLGSFLAGVWPADWLAGAIYTSSASLQEKSAPATKVNAGRGKKTGRGLTAKEARVVQTGKERTEYYSNGPGKADTSQGLDNQQGKKLRDGHMKVVGGTAPLMHHQNPKPQATGSGSYVHQG